MTISMNFVISTYSLILDYYNAIGPDEVADFEMNLPDGSDGELASTFYFKGIITELPMEVPADDKVTNTVTVVISGKLYIKTAPSSSTPTYPESES